MTIMNIQERYRYIDIPIVLSLSVTVVYDITVSITSTWREGEYNSCSIYSSSIEYWKISLNEMAQDDTQQTEILHLVKIPCYTVGWYCGIKFMKRWWEWPIRKLQLKGGMYEENWRGTSKICVSTWWKWMWIQRKQAMK